MNKFIEQMKNDPMTWVIVKALVEGSEQVKLEFTTQEWTPERLRLWRQMGLFWAETKRRTEPDGSTIIVACSFAYF